MARFWLTFTACAVLYLAAVVTTTLVVRAATLRGEWVVLNLGGR